jgi:toxin HigB-1
MSVLEYLHVPPSNQLEELHGNRKDQYSIPINIQWRICFSWKGSDTFDLEIAYYY